MHSVFEAMMQCAGALGVAGMQHAPVLGGGQRFGMHATFRWNMPPAAWHCVCVVIAHPPLGRQHAPVVVVGQVVDVHIVPAPRNEPPCAMHCCCDVWTQPPTVPGITGRQQAPVAPPQMVLVQVVPLP
jgi:hypothetical protein